MSIFTKVFVVTALAVSMIKPAYAATSCNDIMNSRPVNNAMRFSPADWQIGKLAQTVSLESGYGEKGNRKSGKTEGYIRCTADAGTPVAVHRFTGEMRFIQCGNPLRGVSRSDVEFETITIDRRVEVQVPGPIEYRDRIVPASTSYAAQAPYAAQAQPQFDRWAKYYAAPYAGRIENPVHQYTQQIIGLGGAYAITDRATKNIRDGLAQSGSVTTINNSNVDNLAEPPVVTPGGPVDPGTPGGPVNPGTPINPAGIPTGVAPPVVIPIPPVVTGGGGGGPASPGTGL